MKSEGFNAEEEAVARMVVEENADSPFSGKNSLCRASCKGVEGYQIRGSRMITNRQRQQVEKTWPIFGSDKRPEILESVRAYLQDRLDRKANKPCDTSKTLAPVAPRMKKPIGEQINKAVGNLMKDDVSSIGTVATDEQQAAIMGATERSEVDEMLKHEKYFQLTLKKKLELLNAVRKDIERERAELLSTLDDANNALGVNVEHPAATPRPTAGRSSQSEKMKAYWANKKAAKGGTSAAGSGSPAPKGKRTMTAAAKAKIAAAQKARWAKINAAKGK